MNRTNVPIGLLFSSTGSYGTVARTLLNGANLACEQINRRDDIGVRLEPFAINPGSDLAAYAPAMQIMLDRGIKHIVGCYTSSSRKEVIPLIEKCDGLLWYPSHYEGFESSTGVVYTGASPNHHMSPLIDYLFTNFGRRAFCVGSNYIWGWESNRILREGLQKRGGGILAERYIPVGDTDVDSVIDAIFRAEPDFVFSALIGESSYAFFRKFRAACAEKGIDQVARFPIASCNLSEPELVEIGSDAADGHISSSVYFSSLPGDRNDQFVTAYNDAFPDGPVVSAEAEAAFIAVSILANAVEAAGCADVNSVKRSVVLQKFDAPQGCVMIDPETLHAYLTPRIGRSRSDCTFDVIVHAHKPVRPDPYMIRSSPSLEPVQRQSLVRIVS
ncbi:aliphatic amidase expression-regulating protein [Phyllobacterium phragmitis]|uniref:Aliphatic amidase expression-regulating protein n=1 Tax=Phyllobacterium phragmitis TaxID=2670329 RepID=A0A2S9IJ88_9HYPH|nr:transporter substrate-binding domain-containing protein [Phyllobacterium phragmitis]PRD40594.1 aliphatic amidase expression-regulating protein [Phyllobacterium phragmitis]